MAQEISIYEHAVRMLRFMRCSGESRAEQERVAGLFRRNLNLDPAKLLAEAQKPGEIDGNPWSAAAAAKAKGA
jgi:hypothetical protein